MTNVEAIYQQALQLDQQELAELLDRLAKRLPQPRVHESWMEVVRERQAALGAGRSETVAWAEVRERMFKRARGD